MKLLLFTPPSHFSDELTLLNYFFENGLNHLHVRKPKWTVLNLEEYLQAIPKQFHQYIMLHQHHHLVEKYDLKGYHFTEKSRNEIIELNKQEGKMYSTGFHSFEAALESDIMWDYIFLSPIFDSISKEGYTSQFSENALKEGLSSLLKCQKVMALGGVSLVNLSKVKEYGFDGYGILGGIWNKEEPFHSFSDYMKSNL